MVCHPHYVLVSVHECFEHFQTSRARHALQCGELFEQHLVGVGLGIDEERLVECVVAGGFVVAVEPHLHAGCAFCQPVDEGVEGEGAAFAGLQRRRLRRGDVVCRAAAQTVVAGGYRHVGGAVVGEFHVEAVCRAVADVFRCGTDALYAEVGGGHFIVRLHYALQAERPLVFGG